MLFFAFVTYFVPEPDTNTLIRKEKESNPSGKISQVTFLTLELITLGSTHESWNNHCSWNKVSLSIPIFMFSLHNFPEGIAVYLICLRGFDLYMNIEIW